MARSKAVSYTRPGGRQPTWVWNHCVERVPVHGMVVVAWATTRSRLPDDMFALCANGTAHADYSTPLVNLSTAEHVRRAICDIQSSTTRATA